MDRLIAATTIFWFFFGCSFSVWDGRLNMKFIYMIICKVNEPTFQNTSIKLLKLSGKHNIFKEINSIFIHSKDSFGYYRYECFLLNGVQKLARTVFDFKLEDCEDICLHFKRILVYSSIIEVDFVDLRKENMKIGRHLLSQSTLSPAMNEPNIFYYFIAVILSVVVAILIIILCIMCFEPYRRGASEISIEDESVQADIKSPPCVDLLRFNAKDNTRVCKEYKKSAYDFRNGSRRTLFSIENMHTNETDEICPMKDEGPLTRQKICPMKHAFRVTGGVPCPACPSCPNFPPQYHGPLGMENYPTAPPQCIQQLPMCIQQPPGHPPAMIPLPYNPQFDNGQDPNQSPIFPKDSPYNNPAPYQRPVTYIDAAANTQTMPYNNPTQTPGRKPSENPSYKVAIPSHLMDNSRECEVSDGYRYKGNRGKSSYEDYRRNSQSRPCLPFFGQKNIKEYNKNRIIEKRFQ